MACTSITNVNLEWANFAIIYAMISFNQPLESHAFLHSLNLSHFLKSWGAYKRLKLMPPPNLLEARVMKQKTTMMSIVLHR